MQKQAPTVGRLLVMVTFALSCFGLLLFLWLAFGGPVPLQPKGYRFHTSFGEATQLAKEADVRISGVSVGKVKDVAVDKGSGRSDATIELASKFAPLPVDTRATLRQKTLLGETYVELTPGNRRAGFVKENGRLPTGQVASTVELDEIFRAFDPKTRANFQSWMQNLSIATKGRGRDLSDALGNLAPFAQDTNDLLKILNSQEGTVRKLSANTGEVFAALSERKGQLSSLISNSNRVFDATAKRSKQLQETFVALPTFEKEARTTVDRLTAFSRNADPLITQLRPAARELSPTLTSLSALAPDLRELFRGLGPVITASKAGLPATSRFLDELHPVLQAADPTLAQLNPILSFVGLYKDELNSFFANGAASTEARDNATGVHYLRTTNPLNLENLSTYTSRLGTNRSNPYQAPGAYRQLKQGLPVFDTSTCGAPNIPTVVPPETITSQLGSNVAKAVSGLLTPAGPGSKPAAPPCRAAGKFTFGGATTLYPHVNAARDGSSPSGSKK